MHRHVIRTAGLWTLACSAIPALAAAQTPVPGDRTDTTRSTQEWSQQQRDMKGMPGMSGMQGRNTNPHHQLAAAHHASFVTFTRLVHENAQGGPVGQNSGQNSWQNEQNRSRPTGQNSDTTQQPGQRTGQQSSEQSGGKSSQSNKTGQAGQYGGQSGPIGSTEFRALARTAVTEMQRSFEEMQKHHQAFASAKTTAADSSGRKTDMKDMAQHQTTIRTLLSSLRKEVDNDTLNPGKISTLASDILRESQGMPGMGEQPVRSARMQ